MDRENLRPIFWEGSQLRLLDQRQIPGKKEWFIAKTADETIFAIREMVVRGAPAIAITGLFGVVLELKNIKSKPDYSELESITTRILNSRPTAVNLRTALQEFHSLLTKEFFESNEFGLFVQKAEEFAVNVLEEDIRNNISLAKNGLSLFPSSPSKISILTHCNTGALATGGHGTALGVIRSLRDAGHDLTVYADETRPYLQGARLTTWELLEEGIPSFLITDSTSGWLMSDRKIDAVIVGVDRVAANGDAANKVGTFPLAIVAKHHGVPFYIAATEKSFDFKIRSGKDIPIEMRSEEEVTRLSFLKKSDGSPILDSGVIAPKEVKALNPSFDVTPSDLITAFITERGIVKPSEIGLVFGDLALEQARR
ncbi:S-methyl-5-thioribose-1-phosphate isomerase [Leptospira perolatii]|uniref:Methylthioribose-1-phosphate isomerase n=1 Tax=Leptospira perolatii TaxID=2023191 RepID=A0A2M9ZPW4_9LEPT|nr:S-methyl-5-thioribose-1-phosphate isomerase [Leptospira perolatii]PJZ69025.1 S-methyl-5-thioribose-1-phosphate isomerase [Leptospira perolatii]PJZ74106.1 S-methyl-5-thioribose-1-phosphate isomerase [Leptospira perolatii]